MLQKQSGILSLLVAVFLILGSCKDKDNLNNEESASYSNYKIEAMNSPQREEKKEPLGYVRSIKVRNIGPLYKVFNDSNFLQLQAAAQLGIDPLTDLSSYYFTKRPLVKVTDNAYYHIDSLRHSLPYLVPEAAALLQEIGKNFLDSLANRGGDSYKIKVTSLLRTPELVGKLRRVNINATDSSTHQFATTFDISYTNFECQDENRQINQGDLKNLLAEVLSDLREKGRCYVKYEHKTGCFHITVRK